MIEQGIVSGCLPNIRIQPSMIYNVVIILISEVIYGFCADW